MKVAFHTFGCKLNQFETESIASSFQSEGCELMTAAFDADLFIINTCTVTSKSEQKARKLIRSLACRNPSALIIVTGCYAESGEEILHKLKTAKEDTSNPGAITRVALDNIVVVPQTDKPLLHDFAGSLDDPLLAGCFLQNKKETFLHFYQTIKGLQEPGNVRSGRHTTPFDYQVADYLFHSRAFLKIQDGCDNRCTYCRVPLARGPALSLDPLIIYNQLQNLKTKGYREVVVTGVNITAYSYHGLDFFHLLKEIQTRIPGLRIRLSSLEPEKLSNEFCEVLADPSVCPHFHIPVQSGSDTILSAMKRRYRRRQLEEVLKRLQKLKPGAFLAADIIVGFPGETEEDFIQTYELVRDFQFAYLHVFPFSPRPGTPAYQFKPQVHSETIRDRVEKLLDLSTNLFRSYLSAWQGKMVEAVLETKKTTVAGQSGETWEGLSSNYLKLTIKGIPSETSRAGELVTCKLALDQELLTPYPACHLESL